MTLMDRARRAIPARLRAPVGRATRRTARTLSRVAAAALPESAHGRTRRTIGRMGVQVPAAPALDPLGLFAAPTASSGGPARSAAGRAAAAVGRDAEAAHRLGRALHGAVVERPDTGGRAVSTVAGQDLVEALEDAGHLVRPLVPGTCVADIERSEAVIVDMDGIAGVWSGALDAEGVALWRELLEALKRAHELGQTVWVVDRGRNRVRLGAVALRRHSEVQCIRPSEPAPAHHVTEDPEDAPTGIAGLLRSLAPDVADGLRRPDEGTAA